MADLLAAQAGDVFRIGLLIALLLTTLRNRPVTGILLPLAAGAVFVAVIIPLTGAMTRPEPLSMQVLAGLAVNAVYLCLGLAGWSLWQARRR
ncbi:hypothetical protein [Paracoccus benzoatiresistens]|uniref:Integral membrane protein n=1 Tax=Paracoccus benzoatiresistens TaxID=2997341 RepID=A0ABT4J1Z9_9RHOB|nr:hypothetical protein [Paracoccus sp. EF6]MCZ0961111.1 hypothetical protein [Paracoccus sp. EF6]